MVAGFLILGIVLWIIVAFWPARVASRKGYNFFVWFLLSLFFWWITLFVAYMLEDKNKPAVTQTESE